MSRVFEKKFENATVHVLNFKGFLSELIKVPAELYMESNFNFCELVDILWF